MNKKNTKFVQITNIFLLFRSFNLNKFCVLFLPVNVIVRLPHPRSGDSQGQESF